MTTRPFFAILLVIGFSSVALLAVDAAPADLEATVQPSYGNRADGKPGREVLVTFKGAKLDDPAVLAIECDGRAETVPIAAGLDSVPVFLPAGAGVAAPCQAKLTLRHGGGELTRTLQVPALRQWTVYLYPHSHVDIGYTNTQKNVETLHKTNIIEGIKLAEATRDFPAGARYRWNPEVTWPLERLWQTAPATQREMLLQAIRDGKLCVDASYVNINTSSCSEEELFHLFGFSRELEKLSGAPMDTLQQMDIPGFSWGLVPVMAQLGVRYIMAWPNGGDRVGHARQNIENRPCWWVGPDGKSKVLFFQPGNYGNSDSMTKGGATGRPWFGQRDPAKVPPVIKTGSANVNFTKQCAALERPDYPYDFVVLSWTLWDNCPLDADIPDAVKAWNEQHSFPHIVIAGGHEIMSMIERKYGDRLPTVRGDFTEYWTDGLGTAARQVALNRNAKERLVQAETLWTMLHPGQPAPRAEFDEAWRQVMLASEHTWCFENPTEPFFQDAIWKVKQSTFRAADEQSRTLLDEALAPATDRSRGALGPPEGPANGGVAVLNNHSWSYGGLITLTPAESRPGDRVVGDQGKEVLAQRLSSGELAFLAAAVPAFGARHYRVVPGACTLPGKCKADAALLANGALQIALDPKSGNVVSLVQQATNRNFADAKVDGGLNAFRWMPGDSDNAQPDTNIAITAVESGPLVVELRVASQATGCRAVTRSVRLVHEQPWVEFSNIVDKLPLTAKDGIHFGFAFELPQATTRVDIPWGVMRLEDDQWPQGNRNWLVLQRWLDLSNDQAGVTWCSLDAPLFESGAMTANLTGTWGKTRKPWLDRITPGSNLYSWAMNNHWYTNFPLTQDGPVTFRYRILPHGAYDAAKANRFGLEQSQPLVHVAANANPVINAPVTLDNERVTATILKPSADGKAVTLRLRSLSEQPESVKVTRPAAAPITVELLPHGCASVILK